MKINKKFPLVMGILNVTPDSFSDGGEFFDLDSAVSRAGEMVEKGADIIDVGGESTRPGSESVSEQEEIDRVIPVIEKMAENFKVKISCDTSKPHVAESALKHGASMINDVTGFKDPHMRKIALKYNSDICIMHMKGRPRTMQDNPVYKDVIRDIINFLHKRAQMCEQEGIKRENILVDPGIGFGKTLKHNIRIISEIDKFTKKYPVLVGASRKSFLGKILNTDEKNRLGGSLAVAAFCALKGVSVLRVHDVGETKQVIKVIKTLTEGRYG